jgi:hypothetical protein
LGRAKVAGEAGHNAVGKAIGLSIFIINAYFMTRFFVFLILSSTASSLGAGIGAAPTVAGCVTVATETAPAGAHPKLYLNALLGMPPPATH